MGFEPKTLSGCAKVSVIGGGMNGVPGIMAHIVEALTEQEIQILQSADSNTTIWVLVRNEDMVRALRALHTKFELHL
ncbi:Aspartokinase [compost metagenome]